MDECGKGERDEAYDVGDGGPGALVLGGTACTSSPPTATPAPSTTTPTTTVPATTVPPTTGTETVFAGVWPFASPADIDAYDPSSPTPPSSTPRTTAREFAARYVGMDDPVIFDFEPSGTGAGRVGVGARFREGPCPRGRSEGDIHGRGRPARLAGPGEAVDGRGRGVTHHPRRGRFSRWPSTRSSSPVHLSGQIIAFESTAAVEIREDGMVSGQSIGTGFMTHTDGLASLQPPRTGANRRGGRVRPQQRRRHRDRERRRVVRVRSPAAGRPPVTPTLACNDRRTGGGGGFGTLADVRVGRPTRTTTASPSSSRACSPPIRSSPPPRP